MNQNYVLNSGGRCHQIIIFAGKYITDLSHCIFFFFPFFHLLVRRTLAAVLRTSTSSQGSFALGETTRGRWDKTAVLQKKLSMITYKTENDKIPLTKLILFYTVPKKQKVNAAPSVTAWICKSWIKNSQIEMNTAITKTLIKVRFKELWSNVHHMKALNTEIKHT